jgi:hypothetical protein
MTVSFVTLYDAPQTGFSQYRRKPFRDDPDMTFTARADAKFTPRPSIGGAGPLAWLFDCMCKLSCSHRPTLREDHAAAAFVAVSSTCRPGPDLVYEVCTALSDIR